VWESCVPRPTGLTPEQTHALALVMFEEHPQISKYTDFRECLLSLFEDIPGFETCPPARHLLSEIWENYRVLHSANAALRS
jgi:hypothetical protein